MRVTGFCLFNWVWLFVVVLVAAMNPDAQEWANGRPPRTRRE